MKDLAIVSCSYYAWEYLNINYYLTFPYNDDLSIDWYVCQNSTICFRDHLLPVFHQIEGVDRQKDADKIGAGSYHHGLGLNKVIAAVPKDYRYLLVLDPDFYVLPKLSSVLYKMQKDKLAYFGASYMALSKPMFRDFPAAFCQFIDCEKVDIYGLDYSPSPEETEYYGDVGIKVMKEGSKSAFDIAVPYTGQNSPFRHTKKYNNKLSGYDQYCYNDKLWGLHSRMKLHFSTKYKHGKDGVDKHRKSPIEILVDVCGLRTDGMKAKEITALIDGFYTKENRQHAPSLQIGPN